MELMHWHDSFSVGVQVIDDHHRRLFSLVNELILATEAEWEPRDLGRLLDAAVDYARMHFRAEEELFRGQEGQAAHEREHRAFEQYVASFLDAHPLDRAESAPALQGYLSSWLRNHILQEDIAIFSRAGLRPREPREAVAERLRLLGRKPTALVVDDSPTDRRMIRQCLEEDDFAVLEAGDGQEALERAAQAFDLHLVVTDLAMAGGSGFQLIQAIRERRLPSVYIMVVTGSPDKQALVRSFNLGANDYLTKPVFPEEFRLRIRNGMNLVRLESQDELIFAMASLADCRSPETGRHLERVQSLCRVLGQEWVRNAAEGGLTEAMVGEICRYSPLHDIGKVAIPDAVLNKPGRLTAEEFEVMKEHARIGGDLIGSILRKTGSRSLTVAYDLTMYHHERWDGTGYPRGLAGEDIPLPARIMALVDVYDALTSERVYKPAFTREAARNYILQWSGSHFDPALVAAFTAVEAGFHGIRMELKDR